MADGFSGAEIENVTNLAALQSVRRAVASKQEPVLYYNDFDSFIRDLIQEKKKHM
jgi:ATP-dependent Zn protease